MAVALGGAGIRSTPARDGAIAGSWKVDPDTYEMIEAIRLLLEADAVNLVRLDRATGALSISAPDNGARSEVPRVVCETIAAQGATVWFDQQHRWIAGWPDTRCATLVSRVADRDGCSYFLAVRVTATPDVRARIGRLLPSLGRLVRLHVETHGAMQGATQGAPGVHGRGLSDERDAAIQVLDHGECGVIVLRADRSIVLTNAAAQTMLAAEAGLHVRRGTVHPTGYADAVRFQQAIDREIDPPPIDRSLPPRAIVMLLSAVTDERPPIIVLAPARERSGGAAVVIYLMQPSAGAQPGLETLCRIHGLSRVETRLMIHLADGLAVAEAAVAMRIKVETARTYLKQIFGKVGVHRQTDLIGLMSRYGRALRGSFDFQAA